MADQESELAPLRDQIDAIDRQIHLLLNQRAQCALDVAAVKQKYHTGADDVLYYRPEREAQVLQKVKVRNQGPLADDQAARIFREIMSACLALEKPMVVAFLGPLGTYSQAAAVKHFGHGVKLTPLAALDEVFREVESGMANYGVVPVENSTEGMVNQTLDCLIDSKISVCGEVELAIHQHFLMAKNTQEKNIKRIVSHQQSLGQCRKWLDEFWPQVERLAVSSNAEAARLAAENPEVAAIAGEVAAELYNLNIVSERIQDLADNTTRFLIIGNEKTSSCGIDKTSILVSTKNQPGALFNLLQPFDQAGISLTRIETRPSRKSAWAYVFFIDFEGHQTDAEIAPVLKQVEAMVADLKLLGSYPQAVL